jgi:hypothetical protein
MSNVACFHDFSRLPQDPRLLFRGGGAWHEHSVRAHLYSGCTLTWGGHAGGRFSGANSNSDRCSTGRTRATFTAREVSGRWVRSVARRHRLESHGYRSALYIGVSPLGVSTFYVLLSLLLSAFPTLSCPPFMSSFLLYAASSFSSRFIHFSSGGSLSPSVQGYSAGRRYTFGCI